MKSSVLVVDDEHEIRQLLCMMLRFVGYQTFEAANGEDALNKVDEHTPDALILDVMMPKMDGIEVCRTLRAAEDTADLPIILLSGKAQAEDVRAGMEAGANHYLAKPMMMNDLLDHLHDVIANRNNQRRPIA